MDQDRSSPLDAPDNHQSLVKVVTWMLFATSTLCVVVRFITKQILTRTWSIDDTLITFAWAFSLGHSVCLTIAASNGYGYLLSIIDGSKIYTQEKFVFASNILFFLSMCFSMLSTIRLISSLSPKKTHRRTSWFMTAMTIIWTLVAVFGFAFQCRLPYTWDFVHDQCFHQKGFYTFVAVSNLIIEVGLVLQPAIVVGKLQLATKKKVIVILCFFGRATVVVALIAQIVTIWASDSNQETVLYFGFAICEILVENFSIMAASIPYLRPFMESLESGFMGNNDIRRKANLESAYGLRSGDSYVLSSPTPKRQSKLADVRWKFEEISPTPDSHSATAESSPSSRPQKIQQPVPYSPGETEIGVAVSEQIPPTFHLAGGITQTVEYSVQSEPRKS